MSWLGSSLVPADFVPASHDKPPEIMLRLAKIPRGKEVLGDKQGFRYHTRTPLILCSRHIKQYTPKEIVGKGGKKDVCCLQ